MTSQGRRGVTGSKQVQKPVEALLWVQGCLLSAHPARPAEPSSAGRLSVLVRVAVKFSGASSSLQLPVVQAFGRGPSQTPFLDRPVCPGSSEDAGRLPRQSSGLWRPLGSVSRAHREEQHPCLRAGSPPPQPCCRCEAIPPTFAESPQLSVGSSCWGVLSAQQGRAQTGFCHHIAGHTVFSLPWPLPPRDTSCGFPGRVPADGLSGAIQALRGMQPTALPASACHPAPWTHTSGNLLQQHPLPGTKMCHFLVAAITKCHDAGASNNTDLFLRSGGQSRGQGVSRAVRLRRLWERVPPPPQHLVLQATLGVSRLVAASLPSLPVFTLSSLLQGC